MVNKTNMWRISPPYGEIKPNGGEWWGMVGNGGRKWEKVGGDFGKSE